MFKADGSFLVHDDAGGFRPLNWMTPPTMVEDEDGLIVVRKRAGKSEDRLEIRIAEVLSDVTHDMGESVALQKDGVERHLQEELAARPDVLGAKLRLVRREWPTDIGPVDLMCRDESGDWVAVEIKRVGTIDAVEQLSRYLERIELEGCRGILAAQAIKPQARTLAESRGIDCVEVDLAVLRGEREPDLTLFSALVAGRTRRGARPLRRSPRVPPSSTAAAARSRARASGRCSTSRLRSRRPGLSAGRRRSS